MANGSKTFLTHLSLYYQNNYLFMNGKLNLFLAIALTYPLSQQAQGISEIIEQLKNTQCYTAEVNYHILMSLQPDVDYSIKLESMASSADSLSPCNYVIDWTMATPSGEQHGFSAYHAGNLYYFHGERLLEYHYDWDSIPFFPSAPKGTLPGIQKRVQFCSLLPQFLAEQLEEISSDPDKYDYSFHPDTIVNGNRCAAMEGVMRINDEVCKEYLYAFDPKTSMPIYSEIENNPGALVEQTIITEYSGTVTGNDCTPISDAELMKRYPLVFEKFRESNYAIENMHGQKLPGFSLQTTTGERYSRRSGDPFRTLTLVVLIDPKSGFASQTVNEIRKAIDMMPVNADVIWAFTSNNVDEIEEIIPAILPGEHLLMSAKSLARDCGVSAYPVTIITKDNGVVADVVIGFNNDMSSIVIQKAAVAVK